MVRTDRALIGLGIDSLSGWPHRKQLFGSGHLFPVEGIRLVDTEYEPFPASTPGTWIIHLRGRQVEPTSLTLWHVFPFRLNPTAQESDLIPEAMSLRMTTWKSKVESMTVSRFRNESFPCREAGS